MAKTIWGDGSHITSALMTAYWGSGAASGHVHSEANSDGACPQIDLTAHVTNLLPGTSIQSPLPDANITHVHGAGSIPLVDGTNDINFHTGSVDWTSSDCTGGLEGVFHYQVHGKMVHMQCAAAEFAEANGNKIYLTPKADWPDEVVTTAGQRVHCRVLYNGTNYEGSISVPYADTSALQLGWSDGGQIKEGEWAGPSGIDFTTFSYYKP